MSSCCSSVRPRRSGKTVSSSCPSRAMASTTKASPYVLTSSSLFSHPQTAVSAAKVIDIASTAGRSLIFVDACRERVRTGARAGEAEPLSAAPLIDGMTAAAGQVVLYAAAAGKYAYDDPKRQNGVFTATVLEGLQCRAGKDARGLVTVDTLSTYVEAGVRSWVRQHRDPSVGSAIQVSMDGQTKAMPLAVCSQPLLPEPQPVVTQRSISTARPARVAIHHSSLEVFGEDGVRLWTTQSTRSSAWRSSTTTTTAAATSRHAPHTAKSSTWTSTDRSSPRKDECSSP